MSDSKEIEKNSGESNYEELRDAIRHFDRVIRSQILIQGKQGNRIKNSIRAGMLFLCLMGISIFIILITMVTQVELISDAVVRMDDAFDEVRDQMAHVDSLMTRMEVNVAHMDTVSKVMTDMDQQMVKMTDQFQQMQGEVDDMTYEVATIRQQADIMTQTSQVMDAEIYRMNHDLNRMAVPARSMNSWFPIPW